MVQTKYLWSNRINDIIFNFQLGLKPLEFCFGRSRVHDPCQQLYMLICIAFDVLRPILQLCTMTGSLQHVRRLLECLSQRWFLMVRCSSSHCDFDLMEASVWLLIHLKISLTAVSHKIDENDLQQYSHTKWNLLHFYANVLSRCKCWGCDIASGLSYLHQLRPKAGIASGSPHVARDVKLGWINPPRRSQDMQLFFPISWDQIHFNWFQYVFQ